MANTLEKKFDNFLRKKKIKMFYQSLQQKTSSKIDNDSLSIMRNTSNLSSSTILQHDSRSNDTSSAIYATTIIIIFAVWIFKRTTYVNQILFLLFNISYNQIQLDIELFLFLLIFFINRIIIS